MRKIGDFLTSMLKRAIEIVRKDMKQWERAGGVEFLRRSGIGEGATVLDFGCRVGHYSIPAAIAVGERGVVYAVDKKSDPLRKIEEKAGEHNLSNIKTVLTDGSSNLDIPSHSIDFAMVYDLLHMMEERERQSIYSELQRLLKADGILSVYPKHIATDYPMHHFSDFQEDDVKNEVEAAGFRFKKRVCGMISHDEYLNEGCILNFRKAKNGQ